MEAHEYTTGEVQRMVIDHVLSVVNYWDQLPNKSQYDRLYGVAFSILAMLDGSSIDLPAFQVIADPHPDDKAYHQEKNECWFADVPESNHDIGGSLHEVFSIYVPYHPQKV